MREICVSAGLGVNEIALVESCIESFDDGFIETTAYEKLFDYYADEMPYDIAKCRTGEPDVWILEQLVEADESDTARV